MSEENITAEETNHEAEGTEVLPSSEDPTSTIADRLDSIPVEKLPEEQIAELEKLIQEIVYVGIDDVKPSPNKERKNDPAVPGVASSMRQLGFRSPIYVDGETNEIVLGHTRWAAAKKLGFHRIPVVYVFDLSPSKLKLLRIADNKVAEASGWDFTELNKTLDELKVELPDIDLEGLGFSSSNDDMEDLFDKPKDNGESKSGGDDKKKAVTCTCPECGHEFTMEV